MSSHVGDSLSLLQEIISAELSDMARSGGVTYDRLNGGRLVDVVSMPGWPPADRAHALLELVLALIALVEKKHRQALNAALVLPMDAVKDAAYVDLARYGTRSASWSAAEDPKGIHRRLLDLKRCWRSNKSGSQPAEDDDRRLSANEVRELTKTQRRWWGYGVKNLAEMLAKQIHAWNVSPIGWPLPADIRTTILQPRSSAIEGASLPAPTTVSISSDELSHTKPPIALTSSAPVQDRDEPSSVRSHANVVDTGSNPGSVKRLGLITQFQQLLIDNVKLIVLVGPPGIGKTTLARPDERMQHFVD